jgi:hypothetical protein
VLGPPGTQESLELRHGAAEDVAVHEDDGAEGLVPGGGRGATVHCEMIEECGEVVGCMRRKAVRTASNRIMAMVHHEVHRHKQGWRWVGDEE